MSEDYIQCKRCKRKLDHYALGFCKSCYTYNYVETHPEYKEKKRQWSKRWCEKHSEERKAYLKNYRAKKKELKK